MRASLWRNLLARLQSVGISQRALGANAALLISSLVAFRIARMRSKPLVPLALSTVMKMVGDQAVQEIMYADGGSLIVQMKDQTAISGSLRYVTQLVPGSESAFFEMVRKSGVPSFRYVTGTRNFAQVFAAILPFLILFVWFRLIKSLISGEEKFKSSRPRRVRVHTTFADVVSKSKVELSEIVDYLNHPEKFRKVGARQPRGVLLAGPSGTGKTLLARAVAGEAQCAFFSASASEFVEVYVGRGAARVRDLFKQAREASPSVVFIDELDAFGNRARSHDGQHSENVQTLNQLLTELDGFHGHSDGVIVLAATNRHEVIDSSLLRPGRFDRHIFVELPDEEERLKILKIHAERAPMTADVDAEILQDLAQQAKSFSGAELANVINEAVFLALRKDHENAEREDLESALARVQNTRDHAANAEDRMPKLTRFLSKPWGVPMAAGGH